MTETATPQACYHGGCSDCGKSGKPCGRSHVGEPGHEKCTGAFPFLKEGGTPKEVTVKNPWWDSDAYPVFTLRPQAYGKEDWEVFLPDNTWVGTVTRYKGSLDTHIAGTRLRREGKHRTLWAFKSPGSRLTMWEQVSRADCLRRLYREHKRRVA